MQVVEKLKITAMNQGTVVRAEFTILLPIRQPGFAWVFAEIELWLQTFSGALPPTKWKFRTSRTKNIEVISSETACKLPENSFEDIHFTLGSLSLWDHSHSGITLSSLWDHSEITLGSLRGVRVNSGITLGSLRGVNGGCQGYTLGSLWDHSGIT